jgi:hypothetical protein
VIQFVSDLQKVDGVLDSALGDSLSVIYSRWMVFSIHHNVIKFVTDLQQVDGVLDSALGDNVCQ